MKIYTCTTVREYANLQAIDDFLKIQYKLLKLIQGRYGGSYL
jgi:hypothetical protein